MYFILDLEQEYHYMKNNLAIAKLENFSFVDFIELAIDLKYKTEILNQDNWFVKKKQLQDRMVSDNYDYSIGIYELLLIEQTIEFFKNALDSILSSLPGRVNDRIQIMGIYGRELHINVPVDGERSRRIA